MADVNRAIESNTAEIEAAKAKLQSIHDIVSQQLDINTEATAGGTITGPDGRRTTPAVAGQEASAQLGAQVANQRRAETINYEDYSNELLAYIQQQGEVRRENEAKIDQINNGGILDQVLGLVTIPYYAAKVDNARMAEQSGVQELRATNELMQSGARTSAEIQTRVTEATNADLNQALLNDQKAAAAKAHIVALQTGASQVKEILSLSGQQLHNEIKKFEIGEAMDMRALRKAQIEQMMEHRTNMAEDRANARADAADMRALRKSEIEQRMAMRDQLLSDKEVKKNAVDFINYALAQNGKDQITEEHTAGILDQLNKPGAAGEMLRELYSQGLLGALSGDKFTQGGTPVDAAAFREKINYIPSTGTERDILSNVEGVMRTSKGVLEAKSVKERIEAGNAAVMSQLDSDQSNITIAQGSLTKPISWSTMSQSQAFANNKVFTQVIAPQITDNIKADPIDPSDLFKRVGAALKTNQISIDEAVDFTKMYAGMSIQMNNVGLRKLTGLEQTKFIAKLPQPRFNTKLFTFPTTPMDIPLMNPTLKSMLPMMQESVDMLNSNRLYDAYASYLSGQLREPPASPKK